jgi:hypothetical protein
MRVFLLNFGVTGLIGSKPGASSSSPSRQRFAGSLNEFSWHAPNDRREGELTTGSMLEFDEYSIGIESTKKAGIR